MQSTVYKSWPYFGGTGGAGGSRAGGGGNQNYSIQKRAGVDEGTKRPY